MFYCDPCAIERDWPASFLRSRGRCEVCDQSASCSDVPSSQLPPLTDEQADRARLLTRARIEKAVGGDA